MAKKSISQKKVEKQQQENLALQRVFNVFLLGLAAECYLLIVYRGYVGSSVSSMLVWHKILTWGTYLGLAMLVGGIAAAVVKRTAPRLRRAMTWVSGAGLFLAVSGFVMTTWMDKGVTIMCSMVPVLTLLGLVFHLFQHECFASTVALAGSLFAVWVCMTGLAGSWKVVVTLGAVAAMVILAAAALLTYRVQRGEGKWKGLRIFSVECDYRVLYAVLALGLLAILLALVVPGITYYLMWALGILLFAELVYYTTKLM